MAESGFYEVSTLNLSHEVRRSNYARHCLGVGHELTDQAYVYLHSELCTGIAAATLYLSIPDPRDRHMASICIPCVVKFGASKLTGNIHKYVPVTVEQLRAMREELQAVLVGLKAP